MKEQLIVERTVLVGIHFAREDNLEDVSDFIDSQPTFSRSMGSHIWLAG